MEEEGLGEPLASIDEGALLDSSLLGLGDEVGGRYLVVDMQLPQP